MTKRRLADIVGVPIIRNCQMCGKFDSAPQGHHTVPRFLGGDESDIIMVCRSCHRKADMAFVDYLLDPFGENGRGTRYTYSKNTIYRCTKIIDNFYFDDVKIYTSLIYNIRADHIVVRNQFYCTKVKKAVIKDLYLIIPEPGVSVRNRLRFNYISKTVTVIDCWGKKGRGSNKWKSTTIQKIPMEERAGVRIALAYSDRDKSIHINTHLESNWGEKSVSIPDS